MWIKCVWVACLVGAVHGSLQDTRAHNLLQDKWEPPLPPAHNTRYYFIDQPLRPQPPLQESEIDDEVSWRGKRMQRPQGPSLSVANPIEVLRSRLLLEIARRRMKEQDASRVSKNRQYLQQIGKRHTNRLTNEDKTVNMDYYNSGDFDWDSA
ncbi:corticotropin-releasing diuretic hormone 44 [Rhodnius prolixus]|uniref:Corticotropin releasing factor-like protein n=1 Tax=Rhodnius prolixus TaxID=13249 RepID=F1AYR6_RHOPR|nr:corticotropin releasing factor-like protein [Rhodnius prolixus]